MIKKLKTRWQSWLDGVTRPVYAEHGAPSKADPPSFFGPATDQPTAVMPRFQSAHNTAPMILRELHQETAVEQAVARTYEEMGPIAAEMIQDLDRTFAALLTESMAARTAEQAHREGQETWRRVMIDRRSARNQEHAAVDVEHLWRDDISEDERRELVCAGIRARSLHASDPDAPTGLIPVMEAPSYMIEEEDTA